MAAPPPPGEVIKIYSPHPLKRNHSDAWSLAVASIPAYSTFSPYCIVLKRIVIDKIELLHYKRGAADVNHPKTASDFRLHDACD